jgi:periplasmic divalent cation tolerance protein
MTVRLVYITAGDEDEAHRIGRALVESRLAACANIIGGMNSIYWWEGAIHEDGEAILIVKTGESAVPVLIEKVRSMHSYDCPCVVSLPILEGNPDYLDWIESEASPSIPTGEV